MKLSTVATKDRIESLVTDLQVYQHYIPGITPGVFVKSPLRQLYGLPPDDSPSFNIFPRRGRLFFKDMGAPFYGDIWQFVQDYHRTDFKNALIILDRDFGLGIYSPETYKKIKVRTQESLESFVVKPKSVLTKMRSWERHDIEYWAQYHIKPLTLLRYKVFPISSYFVEDKYGVLNCYTAEKYAYVYKLDRKQCKIYQPYSKEWKFIQNLDRDNIQGLAQLDTKSPLCFITSSMKEVMVLYELGFNAIAPLSESTTIPNDIIDSLKDSFRLVLLYDWDEAGKAYSEHHSKLYDIDTVDCDVDPNLVKDLADYCKEFGKSKTKQLVNYLLSKID